MSDIPPEWRKRAQAGPTGKRAMSARTTGDAGRRRGRPPAGAPVGEGDTRAVILAHARRLFMLRGFADVAMGEVAEAVGVTKPTLYYHFGDKESLYAAVLLDLLRTIGARIAEIAAMDSPLRVRLEALAIGYFRHSDTAIEMMLRDASQCIGPAHVEAVWASYEQDFLAPLIAMLQKEMRRGGLRACDPRRLARAFGGLLGAFAEPGAPSTWAPAQHAATAAEVVALFLDGCLPRP